MPTQRLGKVRKLLRDGRACVVRHKPFTIQLRYETTEYTQPVTLGVNAGTGHVGLSATTESRELFAAQVTPAGRQDARDGGGRPATALHASTTADAPAGGLRRQLSRASGPTSRLSERFIHSCR